MSIQCVFLFFVVFSPNFSKGISLMDNITYVGCYDATSSYETVVEPLTWNICISLCIKQSTVYAGINSNRSTCFCGNDIVEMSTELKSSHCVLCHEDPHKFCGGPDTTSVYQLKPKTPTQTTLLLATKQGIEMFQYFPLTDKNYKQASFQSLQVIKSGASFVTYDFLNQDIYYESAQKIFKLTYVAVLMKYYHPILLIETNCSAVVGLELNWVTKKIYWACSATRKVSFANLDGSGVQVLISSVSYLQHIALEPYAQSFFYISQKRFGFYNYDGSIAFFEKGIKEVLQMAIDIQQETFYIIGSFFSGASYNCLISISYKGTLFKVLYTGPELQNSHMLDVVNGTVVWGTANNSKNDPHFALYKGTVSSKCELEELQQIYSSNTPNTIYDVKIYGPDVQLPGRLYLCHKKNCTHSCILVTSSLVRCSCPAAMFLSSDGRTCISTPPESSTPVQPSEAVSWTEESTTEVETKDTAELRPEDQVSHQHLLYNVFIVCVLLFLVIFTLVQGYICMSMKRAKGNFVLRYKKQPASEEPTYSETNRVTCNIYS